MFAWIVAKPRRFTGTTAVLVASHRDQITWEVHEHTWRITAWFAYNGTSHEVCRYRLSEEIKSLQGRCLPDSLAWGENLAAHLGAVLECEAVDIYREAEQASARWER